MIKDARCVNTFNTDIYISIQVLGLLHVIWFFTR